MYPGHVLIGARLVEIEHETAREHFLGAVGHLHRPPRSVARSLHITLPALGVRSEEGTEHQGFLIHVEVHAGVVVQGGLVDADIESVVRPHQH